MFLACFFAENLGVVGPRYLKKQGCALRQCGPKYYSLLRENSPCVKLTCNYFNHRGIFAIIPPGMKETYLRYIRRVFVCAGTPTGLLNTSNKDTIYLAYPFCTAVASSAWCMWRAMLRKNGAACRHIVCRASRPIDANVACGTAEPLHTLYRRMQLCSCAVVMLQLMCCCCCVWCAVCRMLLCGISQFLLGFHPPRVAFLYTSYGQRGQSKVIT